MNVTGFSIDAKTMLVAGIVLLFSRLLWGIGVVVARVLHAKQTNKPIRIDLNPVGIAVDVILVSNPGHMQAMEADPALARLHAIPTDALPLWARLYVRGGRFYDAHRDQWFVPFEAATSACSYQQRCAAIAEALKSMYHKDDVTKVIPAVHATARLQCTS